MNVNLPGGISGRRGWRKFASRSGRSRWNPALSATLWRMKIELLREGSPDCPLVRFHSGNTEDFVRLQRLADQLSADQARRVEMEAEPGFTLLNMKRLCLHNSADDGLRKVASNCFEWSLDPYNWESVSILLQPFVESTEEGEFHQWLDEAGRGFSRGLAVLASMSADGTW